MNSSRPYRGLDSESGLRVLAASRRQFRHRARRSVNPHAGRLRYEVHGEGNADFAEKMAHGLIQMHRV